MVTDTLPPDPNGIAVLVERLCRVSDPDIAVSVLGPPGWSPPQNVAYTTPAAQNTLKYKDVRFAIPSLSKFDLPGSPDLVILHTVGPIGLLSIWVARRRGIPLVFYRHNDLPKLAALYVNTLLRPLAFLLGYFADLLARISAQVIIGPPPAAPGDKTRTLMICPPRPPGLTAASIDRDFMLIGYHGRFSPEKRLELLITTVADLRAEGFDVRLRLIGEGSESGRLRQHALMHRVPVDFVDWIADPLSYLRDCDLYVLASATETWSLATLEALGLGLPVVARSVGSIPHYLLDGTTGLLFRKDHELAHCIRRLITDTTLVRRLTAGALKASVADPIEVQIKRQLDGIDWRPI